MIEDLFIDSTGKALVETLAPVLLISIVIFIGVLNRKLENALLFSLLISALIIFLTLLTKAA